MYIILIISTYLAYFQTPKEFNLLLLLLVFQNNFYTFSLCLVYGRQS